jgi:hypothetical protein
VIICVVLMAKALSPFMRTKGTDRPDAVIANLSARVGSIGDNSLVGKFSRKHASGNRLCF